MGNIEVIAWPANHATKEFSAVKLQGNARRLFASQKRLGDTARLDSAAEPAIVAGLAKLRLRRVLLQNVEGESGRHPVLESEFAPNTEFTVHNNFGLWSWHSGQIGEQSIGMSLRPSRYYYAIERDHGDLCWDV